MIERRPVYPGVERFIELTKKSDLSTDDIEQLSSLAQNTKIVHFFAKEYWSGVVDMLVNSTEAEGRLRQDDAYQASLVLLNNCRDVIAEPIKSLMNVNYGFSLTQLDQSPEIIVDTFFEAFPLLKGTSSDIALGKVFARPMSAFGGRSRLEVIKDGNLDVVLDHGRASLAGSAT